MRLYGPRRDSYQAYRRQVSSIVPMNWYGELTWSVFGRTHVLIELLPHKLMVVLGVVMVRAVVRCMRSSLLLRLMSIALRSGRVDSRRIYVWD